MRVPRPASGILTAVCASLATLAAASPAQAAFPGNNGLIAYGGGVGATGQVWRMNADGTGREVLASNALDPVWSSNGTRIAFLGPGNDDISLMNPDGSGQTLVCSCPPIQSNFTETRLTISPDGTQLAFDAPAFGAGQIHRVNADGTGQVALTSEESNRQPAWSPDGTKIAFVSTRFPPGIWVMNADGTDQHGLNTVSDAQLPDWSPDGTQIAFSRPGGIWAINPSGTGQHPITNQSGISDIAWSPDGTKFVVRGSGGVTVMNADGSDVTPIVSGRTPNWQPIPPGYVRPAGATPVRISLVPAYEQCTSPNRAHGMPLAFSSCGPPQQTSDWLTVGSEANGNAAASTGSLRARSVAGNPATQTDEADVALRLSLTDVRNASDETDYAGELRASLTLRLTDRDNTPFASTPGTMVDHVLTLDAPCTPTGGAAGSTCSIQTTADSLVPSTVKEGRRMVMELGQAQVFDGGPDGDTATAGNTLFAVGGLFVP